MTGCRANFTFTFYMMSTVSIPGDKRLELALNTHPPSTAEVKERVELYLYFPVCLHDEL